MIDRNTLVTYVDSLLGCDNFKDYAPNGLQIEGKSKLVKICTAVSAGEVVVKQAIELGADMLIVHHGYFWRGEQPQITGAKKRRFSLFLQNDLNLCAYHLPLDSHLEIGNNACLAEILPVGKIMSHDAKGIQDILWTGELEKELSASDFNEFLAKNLQTPIYLSGGDKKIKKVAWCSGGAQDFIEDAATLGADAYISGEVSERTFYQAEELRVHYFACGHHATERYGVQELGKHLASKFDLKYEFIDIKNPI